MAGACREALRKEVGHAYAYRYGAFGLGQPTLTGIGFHSVPDLQTSNISAIFVGSRLPLTLTGSMTYFAAAEERYSTSQIRPLA
jgi:hypothetical protein